MVISPNKITSNCGWIVKLGQSWTGVFDAINCLPNEAIGSKKCQSFQIKSKVIENKDNVCQAFCCMALWSSGVFDVINCFSNMAIGEKNANQFTWNYKWKTVSVKPFIALLYDCPSVFDVTNCLSCQPIQIKSKVSGNESSFCQAFVFDVIRFTFWNGNRKKSNQSG